MPTRQKIYIMFFSLAFSFIANADLILGSQVFLKNYTHLVRNKKVALITNPTGVDRHLRTTIDLLYKDKRINLVALFAPEHGLRGNISAGRHFENSCDRKTGLPIYTLYGPQGHRPSDKALSKVDVVIYDIQDVGSRAYTYIWSLMETIQAVAKTKKTVVVFDRPNPLGGNTIDGAITEKKWLSFIGLYPIPRVYGMTVGELALMLNAEYKLKCHLQVIPMHNYKRGMTWEETDLPWVPTSPHIPDTASAYCFAATGTIGELGNVSIGIGYTLPFQCIAAPWINAEQLSAYLNAHRLPGIRFRPIHYKPFYAAFKNKNIHGVQLHIIKPEIFRPETTEITILYALKKLYPQSFTFSPDRYDKFDKASGTSIIRESIEKNVPLKKLLRHIYKKMTGFLEKRKKYLLYK
ncbi:MAG: DUF1343 domain-containing protein [Verrucomicrobiota bacterium]|nr:DUF1343 domain-containing protein [Verrucomicrobiota bacterium]